MFIRSEAVIMKIIQEHPSLNYLTDFEKKTRIPRMELMPTASRYLLELKSFKKLYLKFYISRYLFF